MNSYSAFLLVLYVSASCAKLCSQGNLQLQNQTSLKYAIQKNLLDSINNNFGWDHGETAEAVISLSLSNNSFSCSKDIETAIIKKQLLLEISEVIIKWHNEHIPAGKLAFFINALLATCHDPRSFFGINLVSRLKHKTVTSNYEDALVSLSICNAGFKLPKKTILHLSRLVNQDGMHGSIDTAAMAMLAIACAQQYDSRTYVQSVFNDAHVLLTSKQNADGCFGNIHSSALAAQALISYSENSTHLSNVLNCIEGRYASVGLWNTFSHFYVLPVLNLKSLIHLRGTECICDKCTDPEMNNNTLFNEIWHEDEHTAQNVTKKETKELISVTYSLSYPNVGSGQKDILSTVVLIDEGSTFLDVMKKVAKSDQRFQFTTKEYSFGVLVNSLAGLNNSDNAYWSLYELSESDNKFKMSSNGISYVKPKEGEHFLFRYKQTMDV